MALRVLLVLPIRDGENTKIAPDLGILYLGTAIQKHGYDVTLLDCPKEEMSFEDFGPFLKSGRFDVVGFRCYSRDHNYVARHLKITREALPDAVTLAGGPHPSALPDYVLRSLPDLDFAWKAEAEEGLPVLLAAIEKHRRELPESILTTIPGLVWRRSPDNHIEINPVSFGLDLDSFGLPAWDLLKPEGYKGQGWAECYPIVTTRGCPYPCTYCNTPGLSGKKLRHRSIPHVLEELRLLKTNYGIERFNIVDDEFTLDRRYAAAFCEALHASGLNLKWGLPLGVRLDSLTPELLQVMEKAGCESMAVGIESGSERVQKLIQKKVTVAKIREKAVMIADCSGIKITGYFMIGFLDETESEILETIQLAKELPLVNANFNLVIPIPGTAIFEEAIREGRLVLDEINWNTCTSDQVAFRRNHVTGERLIQLRRQAYLQFYGRPRILWHLLKSSRNDNEILRAILRKLRALFRRSETASPPPLHVQDPV